MSPTLPGTHTSLLLPLPGVSSAADIVFFFLRQDHFFLNEQEQRIKKPESGPRAHTQGRDAEGGGQGRAELLHPGGPRTGPAAPGGRRTGPAAPDA